MSRRVLVVGNIVLWSAAAVVLAAAAIVALTRTGGPPPLSPDNATCPNCERRFHIPRGAYNFDTYVCPRCGHRGTVLGARD